MSKARIIISAIVMMAIYVLSSCDTVNEEDRLIYVKPASVARNVLIEDFTGQRCVNCPNATDEIEHLQQFYGADTVIAVGIHSGPFAKTSRGVPYSLYTEEGDEYFNYWRVESQPKGVIDRKGTSEYPTWSSLVREELSFTAPVSLSATTEYTDETRELRVVVNSEGIDGNTTGNLQVWLIENGIVDFQYMPDGSVNREYTHNHVFRRSVNGTWGTAYNITEGQRRDDSFTCTLDEGWKPENMAVVVFVYNNAGVQQVIQVPVK